MAIEENKSTSYSNQLVEKNIHPITITIWDNTPISLYKKTIEKNTAIYSQSANEKKIQESNKISKNNDAIFIKHIKKKPEIIAKNMNKNELEGILLTDKFFKSKIGISEDVDDISDSDSSDELETYCDIKKTISYLNSENDCDSESESIFID